MAVDEYRDTHHITRIKASELEANWAAQAYRPDVINAFTRVKEICAWGTVLQVTNGKMGQGRTPIYGANGVRCLKTKQVVGIEICTDECETVTHEFARKHSHLAVRRGDILMNRSGAGSIGRVGIYLQDDCPMTNEHLIRLQVGKPNDAAFMCVFFDCWWGQRVLERGVTGATGQLNLALEYLEEIPVPTPDPDAQTYIGNKVRQAEMLRARARGLEESFKQTVGVVVAPVVKRARFTRIAASDIGEDLNPGRYDPDRLKVRATLVENGAVSIGSFARILTPTAEPKHPSQVFFGLDSISSNSIDVTPETVETAGVGGTCRNLCKGPVISKLRPYLNKVSYISEGLAGALGSTELLCVEGKGLHPAFVYGLLKLDTTTRQLNPVATGATHPRVSSGDVLEAVVPMHDDHEKLGKSLEVAQESYAAARQQTSAARLLVEALIERKVTEAELVAAHKNTDADRALMARLTADGLDGAGAEPLFPDLDRLEELLNEARQGDDE